MMIDTHAHPLLCERPLPDFFKAAKLAGVSRIIGVATTIKMGLDTLSLSREYPELSPTIGIHPCEAALATDLDHLATILRANPEFVAIGEIGLDYYRDNAPEVVQNRVFHAQMAVARDLNLPVILHSRSADVQMKLALQPYSDIKKVFHCYSSDLDFAKAVADDTTYFSFTGMVTYSNKAFLADVIRYLPLDRMMIETDCPYLTPTAFAGQENQSAFVGEVARQIASYKGIPVQDVITQTSATARQFFGLGDL